MTGVSMKVTYRLRNGIMQKINRMPLGYFDRVNHGEVLSRVTNDVDTLSQTLNQSITQVITSVTTLVGILAMMFSISWELTLVALCILPVSMLFVSVIVNIHRNILGAARVFGSCQRTCGRDVRWTCGDEGLQRRAKQCGEVRRLQRPALSFCVEIPIPFRVDDACDELCRQCGLCSRLYFRWLAGGKPRPPPSAIFRHLFNMCGSLPSRLRKLPTSAMFCSRP